MSLRLLGPLAVSVDGAARPLPGRKAQAVLVYLARRPGEEVARETLCGLLWGDSDEAQARASLRQALVGLRKCLGAAAGAALEAGAGAVRLAGASVDCAAFEAAGRAGDRAGLDAAEALCRGDLWEGAGPVAPEFDRWLEAERAALRALLAAALTRRMRLEQADGAQEALIATATRLLALDPLQENVHRRLMQAYAAQGRHDAALRQFELLRQVLADDLGVEPEPVTVDLMREIRRARQAGAQAMPAAEPEPSPRPVSVPRRPSVAVLPFEVLSDDREASYFGEGVAEDITIELSRGGETMVVAPRSARRAAGEGVPLAEIGRRLGVRFCLTGTVRAAGDRVRVAAHLIRAADEAELWAERYDRDLSDIFAIQTDIARTVSGTVVGRIHSADAPGSGAAAPGGLAAYDLVLRGISRMHSYTEAGFAEAEESFAQAVRAEPDYGRPHGLLALTRLYLRWYYRMDSDVEDILPLAQRAVALDGGDAKSQCALGMVQLLRRRHARAGNAFETAVRLNRNDDLILTEYARYLMYCDRGEEGIRRVREAMRLNPYHPNWYWNIYGRCLHVLGRYDEAIAAFEHVEPRGFWVDAYMAACHAMQGRGDEAARLCGLVMKARPDFTLERFGAIFPHENPATRAAFYETLRAAGLP